MHNVAHFTNGRLSTVLARLKSDLEPKECFTQQVDRLPFCMSALSADVLRALEKISFEKLSELQKFILVALMEPKLAAARPREFAAAIRRLYWGRDTPNTRKSLSRALQRLEQRGYIMRLGRRWQLTHSDPLDNGVMMAFLAWDQRRELYIKFGFQGALRLLKTESADPEKETEKQSVSQIEQVLEAPQKERPGVKNPLDP